MTRFTIPKMRLSPSASGASLLIGSLGLVVTLSHVATAATNFQVTASVMKGCLVTTPPTLGFGTYDPNAASPAVNTTSFAVTCSAGTPYSIGMSAGNGTGATVSSRAMTSTSAAAGNNTLNYGLYKDSSYATNWDNSVSATGYSGTGNAQSINVYGRIPTNQYGAAPATDYSDTITVTLSY